MSIVLGGVLFQNGIEAHSGSIEAAVGDEKASKFLGTGAAANVGFVAGLGSVQKDVVRHAYASSLRDKWILYACTAAVGMVASAFIGKQSLTGPRSGDADSKRGPSGDLELQTPNSI